ARIRAGGNPADDIQREKKTPTLRAFADEYLRRSEAHWKPSGRRTMRIYLKARILPAFGRTPLDAISTEDVAAWFDAASRDKPGAANRALEILRAMMFRAEEWGLREPDTNPCLGIARNPRNNVARFLDTDELARLGRALDANEARWPEAVAAIRLLALTGCRRSEVLDLRWRDIGEDAINLRDSKTGPRAVPLGEAARALIEALPGPRDPDAFLFPRHAQGRGIWILTNCWRTACADTKLGRLRLHDLRHTAASQAVMAGENLPLVGKLLGHRRHRTTAGYAHVADDHLVEAAEKVGNTIAAAMTNRPQPM
ncbi:MAG: tyrosine-type recombinase/integrase, partial [Alphaproteobacteria bacterium]|nr:tyrosine-type recombinase/integrase [Alphaproteobacteria bacterium]